MARKRRKRRRDDVEAEYTAVQPTSNKATVCGHERPSKRKRHDGGRVESKRQKSQQSQVTIAVTQCGPAYFNSPGWKRHVLFQLFPSVRSLATYLTSDAICLSQSGIHASDDAAGYVQLLQDTLVVPFVPFSRPATQSFTPPGAANERLRVLLLRAVDHTLCKPTTRSPFYSSNQSRSALPPTVPTPLPLSASLLSLPSVLSLGFRLARGDSDSALIDRPSVESVDINSMSSHIQQSREWQLLTERAGDVVMAHLLLQCFCFAPLPNLCFMQLTGPPLTDALKVARTLQTSTADRAETEKTDRRPSLKRAASGILSQHMSPVKRTCTDPAAATISAGVGPPSRASSVPAALGVAPTTLLQRVIPQSAILYQQSASWQVGLPPRRQIHANNTHQAMLHLRCALTDCS